MEYYLYKQYYLGDKQLSFVGFTKEHPHDDHGIIRVGFKQGTDIDVLKGFISNGVSKLVQTYKEIQKHSR